MPVSEDPVGWIDASRPLGPGTAVWPGDRPFELDVRREGRMTISSVSTTCHVGTHLDAPRHLDPEAPGVDGVPLDRLMGGAEVVAVAGRALVTPADLPAGWVPRAPRVLVRTDSHPLGGPIDGGFSALTAELVEWLAGHGVRTVGIDTPSVDPFDSTALEAHRALLERGVTSLEGLWLGDAVPGLYLMVALPMPLVGADAAPTRVLLRPLPDPVRDRDAAS